MLAVVDGVRRIETYLRLEDGQRSLPALIGSLGVGGLLIELGRSQAMREALQPDPHVQRHLLALADTVPPALQKPLPFPGQTFTQAVPGLEGSQLILELQSRMRAVEADVARALRDGGADLIIADGPLHDSLKFAGPEIVGCIKSHKRRLLPEDLAPLLYALQPGERTPIFQLDTEHGYERLSWYLRLAAPALGETALAGLVRLEVTCRQGLQKAQEAAAWTSAVLPRLKSHRFRDPRSPQNLVPVGALERELRRRLGDPALIQRRIRQWVA